MKRWIFLSVACLGIMSFLMGCEQKAETADNPVAVPSGGPQVETAPSPDGSGGGLELPADAAP